MLQERNSFDCQSIPGARCYLDPNDENAIPQCLGNMSCSPEGRVLVDGVPCSGTAPPPLLFETFPLFLVFFFLLA